MPVPMSALIAIPCALLVVALAVVLIIVLTSRPQRPPRAPSNVFVAGRDFDLLEPLRFRAHARGPVVLELQLGKSWLMGQPPNDPRNERRRNLSPYTSQRVEGYALAVKTNAQFFSGKHIFNKTVEGWNRDVLRTPALRARNDRRKYDYTYVAGRDFSFASPIELREPGWEAPIVVAHVTRASEGGSGTTATTVREGPGPPLPKQDPPLSDGYHSGMRSEQYTGDAQVEIWIHPTRFALDKGRMLIGINQTGPG